MKLYCDCREIKETNIAVLAKLEAFDGYIFHKEASSDFNIPLEKILIISDDNVIYDHVNNIAGKLISIQTPEDMKLALESEIDSSMQILIIETGDWHIIPLENLIAKYNNQEITLIASASTPEEINLLKGILEIGMDGCLLQMNSNYSISDLLQVVKEENQKVELIELVVSSIKKIGSGDRVCVDTCSILIDGEGLLVGSTSSLFVLVEAEVADSGFVNSRPFRINAGVVASYLLNGEKTVYLSELEAGSQVMVTDRKGYTKFENVARVKIERRPLILVKVEYKNKKYPVVLQDAETVRLMTSSGSTPVNEIKPGDTILGTISSSARHFGMKVDEFLEER